MNRYHITVIAPPDDMELEVVAKDMSISEAGVYTFYDADRRQVAYFPCGRTVISKVEYDIDGGGEKSNCKVTDLNNGVG